MKERKYEENMAEQNPGAKKRTLPDGPKDFARLFLPWGLFGVTADGQANEGLPIVEAFTTKLRK